MSAEVHDLKEALAAAAPSDQIGSPDRAYLFVSFDLIEATAFKSMHKEWPVVISKFYELSVRELQEVSPKFRLWKLAGDEVLMYREIISFPKLAEDVKKIHLALNKVIEHLFNTFETTRNILSIKGAVWIARATTIPPQEMQKALTQALEGSWSAGGSVNVRIQVPLDSNSNAIDFLGPDIDVGFRISEFADKRKLVISANLANILRTESPRSFNVSSLKIVSLEQLKGVWNGRPYPIIWYYDDWSKIQDTFYYDESIKSTLVQNVLKNNISDISTLEKIYEDLNRTKEVLGIADIIRSAVAAGEEGEEITANPAKLAEVHCAAVCFRADGKILIGRRPTAKRRLEGIFEFGCGQLKPNQSFEECLRESYREDFGVELGHISKLPVNVYVIEAVPRVPGLLFYAEIQNAEDVEARYVKAKHTEIRWFDPERLGDIQKDQYVPDFDVTVSEALRAWRHRHP